MSLVLTNATLIDCVDPNPVSEASVVIEDGRIAEITDGSHSPAGRNARVIDLGGAYLLPGLWDVHVHPAYATDPNITVAQQTAQFGQNLMRGLTEGGVVGARSGGAGHFMDVAWRDTFASGELDGPRVFACGNFLTTTGGHFLTSGHARECDGPYGFVNAVREQIKNGVDHIKLNLSGGIMGPSWDLHTHPFLLEDELTAAFAVCRQRGFDVMAHATNPDTVKTAIKLGAHSVEHGYIMDEECIQLFLEHDCWYVPTLGISHLTPSQASSEREKRWVEQKGRAPDLVARAEAAVDTHRSWFQKALHSGVKMALGSDLYPLRESALLEMGLWVKDGATTWQTLLAATRDGAALCGMEADLGTVEAGKIADLIVVGGNPLEDIENLGSLLLVLKEGKVVGDHRPSRS